MPSPIRLLSYLLVLLLALWSVLYVTKGRFLKKPFERIATAQLHRKVTVGGDFQLYLNPLNIKFVAERFAIANPDWTNNPLFFHADKLDARISLFRLIFGHQRFNWLNVVNGEADLQWRADGKANNWTLGDAKAPPKPFHLPDIRRALITGTRLSYRDPRLLLAVRIKVDTVRAVDTRFADDIRFSGDGTIRQRPFTLTGGLMSPNETAEGGRNQLALRVRAPGTLLDVNGTLPAATQIQGADLHMQVRGDNLARLFDFLGVAIPETRRYTFRSDLTKDEGSWRFTHLRGAFGDSDLAGRMTISMPDNRLHIGADLATRSLDMRDVGPFIGYDPQRLEKQGAAGAITTIGGTPRLLPDAPLRIDAIGRFDADVRYTVRAVSGRNIPISNIGLTLDLDHSLLKLSPLTFDMAGGFVSSDISIDARRRPVHTQYDIRLSPTPMGRLLGRWGVEESGTSGTIKGRIQMEGDGDTVHDSLSSANGRIAVIMPKGTMWARNIQLSELDIGVFIQKMFQKKLKEPVEINCGLIAFTVRGGIASADPILIDTTKNVILGRGSFSFRDESVNLAFRADGKKFSLFSAQSPIGLNGQFAKPGINPISADLLLRGGAAIGLGTVLTPLGAILSFVDIGDARSAACGPVLAGANARAQRTSKGKARDDVGGGTPSKAENGG